MRVFTYYNDRTDILNPNEFIKTIGVLRDPHPDLLMHGMTYWRRHNDHSKFGYTITAPFYFCVGDNNRELPQLRRGGNIVCIQSQVIVDYFKPIAVYILGANALFSDWYFEPYSNPPLAVNPADLPDPKVPPNTDQLLPNFLTNPVDKRPPDSDYTDANLRMQCMKTPANAFNIIAAANIFKKVCTWNYTFVLIYPWIGNIFYIFKANIFNNIIIF